MSNNEFTPVALFGQLGAATLLSAFQIVAGLNVGIDPDHAEHVIAQMTSVTIGDAELPEDTKLDLDGWLDWLATVAEERDLMQWWQPFAWAVPAAKRRHW
jgi:hypothetical protein